MGKKRQAGSTWPLVLLVIVIVAVVAIFFVVRNNQNSGSVSQLTGQNISSDEARRPIIAVMIENSPAARPQTGLSQAGIVYETTTEGGITRYQAYYQENQPDIVGPVRSLRPYFVDWALGYDAAVAHVGGSPQALSMAKDLNLKDLDQFKHSGPFFRDNSRPAPHNMYVHMTGLRDLTQQLGYGKSSFNGYPRKNNSKASNPTATNIAVNFSSADYRAEFKYDAASNSYLRYLAGSQQIDKSNNQPIKVKNVVVLKMSGSDINAQGSGQAMIFYDGRLTQAGWNKDGHDRPVRLTDNNGQEIKLNRGSTWFCVINNRGSVSD